MPRASSPWITIVLLAVGLPVAAFLGLWGYMRVTAKRLHPDPDAAPSQAGHAAAEKWTGAVERARRIARAGLAERNLPGVSAAVGIAGEIVWAEGFGFADLENRIPVTPEHRFRIGTASVALTSAAAGLLLEKGRLKLDDSIRTLVPEFPEKQWPVTLRGLMGHVAGVKNDGGDEGPLFSEHCGRPVEALRHFADDPLLFEPGTRFRYSSYGWILLSAAIEAAARAPFLTFLREQVFDPLEMTDTVADAVGAPIPQRAPSYFPRYAADPAYGLHPMREADYSCYAGAGVFLSTPSDLVRFGMAIAGGKLLRPATVETLQTPQRLVSGEETGYGLGWDLDSVTLMGEPARTAGHNGDVLGGMAATLMTFPERGLVVAVTSNISYADTFSMAARIAQAFAGQGGDTEAR